MIFDFDCDFDGDFALEDSIRFLRVIEIVIDIYIETVIEIQSETGRVIEMEIFTMIY